MLKVDADITRRVVTVRLAEAEPPRVKLRLGNSEITGELLPPGDTVVASLTVPEKPLTLASETVKVAFCPTGMFWLVGPAMSVKLGVEGSTVLAAT